MTIPAGGRVMVQGLSHAGAGTSLPVNVLVDELPSSELPGGLFVSLSLLKLKAGTSAKQVSVEIENHASHSVIIPPKTILCNLFQATVVNNNQSTPPISDDSSNDNFLLLFDEALHVNLSPNQVNEVRDMLCHWKVIRFTWFAFR